MTSRFIQDTCLLLRHDGCKKGTYPVKGQGCKPSKGRLGQPGQGESGAKKGNGNGWKIAAGIGAGTLAAGALGAGIYANTNHGKRTFGKVEENLGRKASEFAKSWDEGTEAENKKAKEKGASDVDVMKNTRQNKRISRAISMFGDDLRRSGKLKQAQGRNPNKAPKKKEDPKPVNDVKPFKRKKPDGGTPVPSGRK